MYRAQNFREALRNHLFSLGPCRITHHSIFFEFTAPEVPAEAARTIDVQEVPHHIIWQLHLCK